MYGSTDSTRREDDLEFLSTGLRGEDEDTEGGRKISLEDTEDAGWALCGLGQFRGWVATAIALWSASVLGAFVRLWLKHLEIASEPYILAQVIACWLYGFLRRNEYSPLLSFALRVGFCGSLSTFSSWVLASSETIVDESMSTSERVVRWAHLQATCLGAGLVSYHVGYKQGYVSKGSEESALGEWVAIVLGLSVSVLLALSGENKLLNVEFMALAVAGASCRYVAAWGLNVEHHFPSGTFVANAVGCVVIGVSVTWLPLSLRVAMADGFCGSLSTLSTFVGELYDMKRTDALAYCALSIILNNVMVSTILTVFAEEKKMELLNASTST